MLDLLGPGRVRAVNKAVLDGVLGLLLKGEPLEGQGGPFKFLDHESVVKIAAVLHPHLVPFLRAQLIFLHYY